MGGTERGVAPASPSELQHDEAEPKSEPTSDEMELFERELHTEEAEKGVTCCVHTDLSACMSTTSAFGVTPSSELLLRRDGSDTAEAAAVAALFACGSQVVTGFGVSVSAVWSECVVGEVGCMTTAADAAAALGRRRAGGREAGKAKGGSGLPHAHPTDCAEACCLKGPRARAEGRW